MQPIVRQRMTGAISVYFKHLGLAWPGTFALCFALSLPLSRIKLGFIFDMPAGAPIFPGWLIVGGIAGFAFNRRDRSVWACLVFIPPLALFVWDLLAVLHAPFYGGWNQVVTTFFSRQCGASECLGEGTETAPLYATIAYSVAALWALRRRPHRSQTELKPAA